MDRSANTHAELMGLLGEIKRLLGEIEEQARQAGLGREEQVLAGYRERVYTALIELGEWLHHVQVAALTDDDALRLRSEVNHYLEEWSSSSPIFARIRELSRTRPTQHELLSLLQGSRPFGASISAMVLNDFFIHARCTQAEINRLGLLRQSLRSELSVRAASATRRVEVLCLQYVGGLEWDWLAQERELGQALSLTCVEDDTEGLRHALRQPLATWGATLRVQRSGALGYLEGPHSAPERFDIVYALGLTDSMNQGQAVRLVRGAARALRSGGVFITGSHTLAMPPGERTLRSVLVDWDWYYRDERVWRRLLEGSSFDPRRVSFTPEPLGISLMLAAVRR